MSVNFEYNFNELCNNELQIKGKRTDSSGCSGWDTIIIKKSWISWIITTLRTATIDDYETWGKNIVNEYIDCDLALMMHPAETRHSYVGIFPIWKDEKKRTPAIEIPYLSWNKTKLMSEFIEPFLVDLSKFLSEEERKKLPEPWPVSEKTETEESDNGRISLKLVGEIDPKEYFGK